MKILVSACLLGENCKYSGGNNFSGEIARFLEGHEIISVCPEVMGGLSVPRSPCELVGDEVINREGVSCDKEFRLGAQMVLELAKAEKIDLAILKSRSPSCGVSRIYDGSFSGKLVPGSGITARLLMENGFRVMDSDEIITGGVAEKQV